MEFYFCLSDLGVIASTNLRTNIYDMINFPNRGLTAFPPGIALNETQIRLQQNKLSSIPDTIRQFKALTHLILRHNQIVEIPPAVGELINLSTLYLSNNQIDMIPSEIGKLHKLKMLKLENNKITELPKEISNLVSLTHLYLDNNQISFIPDEFKNLKNLIHLSISGNPLKLPQDYSPSNPSATINYLIDNQNEFLAKDSLITRKAFYFTNASKTSVFSNYDTVLHNFSTSNNVDFKELKDINDLKEDTNVVFIIAPLDVHENESLAIDIAKECIKREIRFYILIQKGFIEKDFESVNIIKGPIFEGLVTRFFNEFPSESNNYSSYEEFETIIYEALKQHKPNIRFVNLSLENIGHFKHLEIPFDNDLTCLIGENGTGKSTILRALALAIIGHDHKKIEERTKRGFLRIQNLTGNKIEYETGKIKLEYSIDGDLFYNELIFSPNDNGNDIDIQSYGDFEIVYNKYNLKSLVLGFPQTRGNENLSDISMAKVNQPHINDLLPLINNGDDYRLQSFTAWITNLYFDSIKAKETTESHKAELIIINAFNLISKITKKSIKFKTVTAVAPPEVWVTTFDSPNGVPLSFVSQGFKIVIGWIGYVMQRFVSTFPLTDPALTFKENAIIILDEVDTSIHPVWQSTLLDVLRETFPNTQFIFTTHSPLMLAGLNREQFVELSMEDHEIIALKNQIDTWALSYRDILQKFFDTTDPIPKITVEELEYKLEHTEDFDEKESIKDNINRLKESEAFENDTVKYEQQLVKKQLELEGLIEKYKAKAQ